MTQERYGEEIKKRITELGEGAVFTASDFSDIANTNVINTTFSRFVENGMIRRLLHGIYDYPKYSAFLKKHISPTPSAIAETIARKNGWTIVPYGDTALNILGLSTQVPAVWIYVSDGAYKKYKYEKIEIEFKRRTNKEISNLSYITALVIQALKALGKENIKREHIKTIAYKLTVEDKEKMASEARYATKWVYELIIEIAKADDYA
ncbi:MAG: DUF6088 family protein [Methanosarcinales archaeon]|jgi:hypothetical protein|nr:DUF6088 family protein [Methanosarcinales archaeon]